VFFLLSAGFWLKILPQLNIKAVQNLKTESLGIILTLWAMFVSISAILLFVVSEVAWRRMRSCLLQLKNFFQKSKCAHHPCTRHHLCAKLTFLGLLSPEITSGEKQLILFCHPCT